MSQENPSSPTAASLMMEVNSPKSIHEAAEKGNLKAVKLYCEFDDFDPNKKDRYGRTALHWAAEHDHMEVVQFLIENGTDVDSRDLHSSRTPLHWASKYGHSSIVKYLLRKGADVNAEDKFGFRPIFLAMQCGNAAEDTQKLLLAMGAIFTQSKMMPIVDPAESNQRDVQE